MAKLTENPFGELSGKLGNISFCSYEDKVVLKSLTHFIHGYAFAKNEKGKISDSVYFGFNY